MKLQKLSELERYDLEDKTVLLKQEYFHESYKNTDNLFRCTAGFGCSSRARGRAIFGYFLSDGEKAKIDRYNVESIVDEDE